MEAGQGMQIGVDFGGTKIEAAALDQRGEFLARRRVANPGDYAKSIKTICELIDAIEDELGRAGTIGIGVPGSISRRTRRMRNANSTWLNGRAFPTDLAQALNRDIRVANDANCLALSEARDGATAGAKVGFAIIIGTGCGGGLTINGQINEGRNGIGGEWGHIPLPWPEGDEITGRTCWCGQKNCLEKWISGPGVALDYERLTGRALPARDIMELSRTGDSAALESRNLLVNRLARAIAVVSNILDPDIFVLGGGLSNVGEIYEEVPEIVTRYVFSDEWASAIVPAKWGDSSGVRGAAQLWAPCGAQEAANRNVIEAKP